MKTAPKDGKKIIVRIGGTTEVVAYFDSDEAAWYCYDKGLPVEIEPEMWRPIEPVWTTDKNRWNIAAFICAAVVLFGALSMLFLA
jgi:hypothetical protein